MVVKQLVLKNRSCYFFSNLVLLKDFDLKRLKLLKYDCGDRYVYHIDYVKGERNVNPFYLIVPEVIGYVDEYEGRKYFNFALTEVNEDVLNEHASMWDGIMKEVKRIKNVVSIKFGRDCHKIKVASVRSEDDSNNANLPLDKLIKFNAMTISNRLLVDKDDKYYPEVYLEECLYDDY